MKISIRTKLMLNYALVITATLLILSMALSYFIDLHFDTFYEEIRQHGMRPNNNLQEFREDTFIEAVRRSILFTVLGAGALSLAIGSTSAHYLISPIKQVIAATKKIAKGDYRQRVDIQTNDELAELGQALNRMTQSLEENEHLKRELVANVSHELATPLTNITGYLEALQDGLITSKKAQQETFTLLKKETKRLTAMVEDVRCLSLAEHPQLKLKRSQVDLKKLIEEATKQMAPQLKAKEIEISIIASKNLPKISLDRNRMLQVILNLLSNAIKFSNKKGYIRIEVKTKDEWVELSITDKGLGIPKKELPYVFERFYRTDKSRSRKTGGTGVGLAIVKELIEAHGGTVHIKSKEGKGTRVICRLPQS